MLQRELLASFNSVQAKLLSLLSSPSSSLICKKERHGEREREDVWKKGAGWASVSIHLFLFHIQGMGGGIKAANLLPEATISARLRDEPTLLLQI